MSETTLSRPKRKTSAEYEAIVDVLLEDMRHLETLMRSDRVEIDRLKTETQVLREESKRLEAESRAALSRLKSVLV